MRAAPGWSLTETTQSLGMLTAALRCPARPTLECQAKIGEQLKAERYIWGLLAKGLALLRSRRQRQQKQQCYCNRSYSHIKTMPRMATPETGLVREIAA
jgi:hypothetical protein